MSPNTVKRTKRVKRSRPVKGPATRGPPPMPAMAVLLVGMLLMLTSLALPWGALNVKTKIAIIPVTLDAKVSEYGVSYTADLSGTQGIIQGTGNVNKKISDNKVFITGLGSFQELIGFIKGSSKYRNYTTEIFTKPENNAMVVVETYSATIPWWPVGISENLKVTVRMSEVPQNISYVKIKKVWIELHQTVNGQDHYKVLWSDTPANDTLKKMGDSWVYSTKASVDSDLGNFSVVGKADLEVVDKDGVSASGAGHQIGASPKMINLWTISNSRTARIGMLLKAMPLTVISMLLLVVSAIGAYARSKWAWKLAAIAAILGILSVAFYYLGVGALIELTGYGQWFSWNPAGPALAALGGCLGLVGCVLCFVDSRKDKRSKEASGLPEDEEEPEPKIKESSEEEGPLPKTSAEPSTSDSEE